MAGDNPNKPDAIRALTTPIPNALRAENIDRARLTATGALGENTTPNVTRSAPGKAGVSEDIPPDGQALNLAARHRETKWYTPRDLNPEPTD